MSTNRPLRILSDTDTSAESDDDAPSCSRTVAAQSSSVRRSSIQRNRSVGTNAELGKAKNHRQKAKRGANNPPRVCVHERIAAFPNEYFQFRSSKLFCAACSEFVSMKLTTIRTYVKTMKHTEGKKRRQSSQGKQVGIAEALKSVDKVNHPMGEMLPEEQRVFRVEVVESFLRGGIPLSKIDHLRPLLEKQGYRLTSSSHMAELIPTIHSMEVTRLREEMGVPAPGEPPSTRPFSVILMEARGWTKRLRSSYATSTPNGLSSSA